MFAMPLPGYLGFPAFALDCFAMYSLVEPLLLRLGAKAAHGAVYALLIVIPLLGWAYSDALSNDTYFFNIELPMMVYYDRALAARIY